ncbi:MAG: asparagine synthase (glutamine-hydrolyzing) [Verrucomicrobiaceae bacterium]|nr:MAG: asparagine synthase (glutamine-hydrolyzing) [Verrucomicrobiaceae bacterium]
MCGICGKVIYDPEGTVEPWLIDQMVATLNHRGPDGRGKYVSGQIGLGHTRLSIIDLHTGDQPMANEDDSIWVVYNGEIYNFPELREELLSRGHRFRSTSDTEVIVHLYEEYGVECLSHLRGMFAFALWDAKRQRLFCARDRVGIKPFYYCDRGDGLVFGSEIKALIAEGSIRRDIDRQAIDLFLGFSYLPGDRTLFRDVRKLEPGHYLLVEKGRITCERYWDLRFASCSGWRSIDDAAAALRSLVDNTVRDHMISDVPVGVLLSGGVDSTIILGCAAREAGKRVKTFTVGFDGAEFADERPFAHLAANLYGAEHHAITISAEEFSGFLSRYIWHMEEPVYEAPAVALHYVSQLASQHVKVVLSGEGGDEAFGGYHNYRNLLILERAKTLLGTAGSSVLARLMRAMPGRGPSGKVAKYARLLDIPLRSYYYSRRSSPFSYFANARNELYTREMLQETNSRSCGELIDELFGSVEGEHALNQMLYVDTKTWLPDDLLVKADKMTMANSLELRVPLLDHTVLEFAAGLPPAFKVNGLSTKRILKKAYIDRLPKEILNRKKVGFPVPIAKWLRTDLWSFVAEQLLDERALARGYFKKGAVEQLLKECRDGQPVTAEVFSLLALELWHQAFVDQGDLAVV